MVSKVTPGVFLTEEDLSEIIDNLSITSAGIVIEAEKGPVLEPVLVTSVHQFLEWFGEPKTVPDVFGNSVPEKPSMYSALNYLQEGKKLWVIRVVGDDAKFSSTIGKNNPPEVLNTVSYTDENSTLSVGPPGVLSNASDPDGG